MNIYTSSQSRPYVYICTHKQNKSFYIGFRQRNVALGRTSDKDLPLYKTSSKIVRSKFDEFDWQILAEFTDGNAAYDFEQLLIHENWDNPLLLNQSCHFNNTARMKFDRTGKRDHQETRLKKSLAKRGPKNPMFGSDRSGENSTFLGKQHSLESKAKIAASKLGTKMSAGAKENMRKAAKRKPLPSLSVIQKRADANRGSTRSDHTKNLISQKAKERTPIVCTYCGKSTSPNNYSRWHGDNCRHK